MKLYFYILDASLGRGPEMTLSECEVIEKPKTYKPVDGFPKGFWGSFVKKEDIGKVAGCDSYRIILTEPNTELAKEKLGEVVSGSIARIKNMLEICERKLQAINDFKDEIGI